MSIRVQLQQFEGPLDLLLYLIRKDEMDIFNINVTEITKQYLEFIKLMKEFDIEVAGDFIAMASTLIQIKSRMLLPQYDENGEIVEGAEDPRKELVQKLLEYEKFKEAAKALYERPLLNRDQWPRGFREKMDEKEDEIELEDNALFSLIGSYRKMVKASLKRIHKVTVKLQSIGSRILEMKDMLIPGRQITMFELLNHSIEDLKERSRNKLITFLSLLELGKIGYVSVYQTENYGDIYVNPKKSIEGDVLSKVEEYGNINADQVADNLFQKTNVITEEELENIDQEPSNFVLQDGDVNAQTEQLSFEQTFAASLTEGENLSLSEDMASDDEILAAEMEIDSAEIALDLNAVNFAADEASTVNEEVIEISQNETEAPQAEIATHELSFEPQIEESVQFVEEQEISFVEDEQNTTTEEQISEVVMQAEEQLTEESVVISEQPESSVVESLVANAIQAFESFNEEPQEPITEAQQQEVVEKFSEFNREPEGQV
ncbi:segregation/condensation protein A [Pseudobdellovibrio sp. HCB154]|uniref:segregation and condensation protein A n=1 Tax=Pseudobdellovibrio sp. HCB154 TaxID=3386277 RepID=UPI003916D648